MNIEYLASCEKDPAVDKETCFQYEGKLIKVKLKSWVWGNGEDTPEGLEIILKTEKANTDELEGTLLATDKIPILNDRRFVGDQKNTGAVAIRYNIIHSIELINESDLVLFVGYPNTYALLEKMLKGVS
jgi:hypothetical protein